MDDPTTTKCIVVADDEAGTRSFLGKLLRRRGYEVLEASDGEEALALAVSRPVDLFLCDLQMPRMRGEDVGRWIDQLDPPVPVILMTAYPSYEAAVSAVRCHAADFLEKPFRSLDVVVSAVEKALLLRDHEARRRAPEPVPAPADAGRRLADAVAEDLRGPLCAVRSLARTLLAGVHGPLTSEQREIVEHIDREAEAAEAEAGKTEFLTLVESPPERPSLEPVPAAEILESVARTLRSRAMSAGADLSCEAADPAAAVLADARTLPRALRAIAENALRSAGDGGRVVLRAEAGPDGVRFEVADDGIGIDPADHARIFQPWVRLDGSVRLPHAGCGLGLAFASRVVEAHGARIHVESALGRGARFWFVLPHATLMKTESCSVDLGRGGAV